MRHLFPDPSDPRIAAELDRLARGGAEMEREIARGEAAARQFAADSAILRAGLAAERAASAPDLVAVVVLVVDADADADAPDVVTRH